MKNVRLYFISVVVIIIPFLFDSCSALDRAKRADEKGNYEEALRDYLKDIKKHPDRSETKERIKTIAEIVVPKRIEQGNGYLATGDYHSAWDSYKVAGSILTDVKNIGISIQAEQHFLERCREAKEEIVQGLYARGNQLMDSHEYRPAYGEFQVINEIIPTGFKDVDQLMNECVRKGQVRIAVVIRSQQKNSWIADKIYPEIKEEILKKSTPFLALVEADISNWDIVADQLPMANMANDLREKNQLDALVILSIAEYKIIPDNKKEEITLCYVTKKGDSYTGTPVKAYIWTNEKTLKLGISYEFIDVRSGNITSIETIRKSGHDEAVFTKLPDSNDSLKDKENFASNCPKPGYYYKPEWYPAEKFVEKPLKSNEKMLAAALESVPDTIVYAVLSTFDK